MTDQSGIQAQYVQKRALAIIPRGENMKSEKTRISKDGLVWHFKNIIYHAESSLNTIEFQLKDSYDFDGNPHRERAEALIANMRGHIAAMEAFIYEQR